MLCYRRFSSLRSVVFLALLCTFLLTIIRTNNTFAEAHIWTYTWTDSTSEVTVTPVSGHVNDSSFCGYKYFSVSASRYSVNSFKFNAIINNSSSGFSLPSFTNMNVPFVSGSFNYYPSSAIIYDCRVKPSMFYNSVTLSDEPIVSTPSGSLSITENGTYDVTSYASAVVDVPPIPGDYHDDLVKIRTSIYTCGAILLVLYFFYCIYRMIIRGVKK